MLPFLLNLLKCPVTHTYLHAEIIASDNKIQDGQSIKFIREAILYSEDLFFFPVIDGVPRLLPEAVLDYEDYLKKNIPDFENKKHLLMAKYGKTIIAAFNKNEHTKKSFENEWLLHQPDSDRTWDAGEDEMVSRFCRETGKQIAELEHMLILDAGSGNSKLNMLLAARGVGTIAVDFSLSVVQASKRNTSSLVHFVQADIEFPPFANSSFDLVHCSGVLIHTPDTRSAFNIIATLVKKNGLLSVWLYHKRKDKIHNLFNAIRKRSSKWPLKYQYFMLRHLLLPISFIIKKAKGNKQNKREMMVDLMDWFTPKYRWEHSPEVVSEWFRNNNYQQVKQTTKEIFGFNITGVKN